MVEQAVVLVVVEMKTVFFHTFGFAAIAPILEATTSAPGAGISFGCSETPPAVISHDTVGSLSCNASYSN